MKKVLLMGIGLAMGLFAFASSNTTGVATTSNTKSVEITNATGETYKVALKQILSDHTTKIVHALYDASTDKIIIDGTSYRWSQNPKYGKQGAGQAAKYKYVVAGSYYFNWEYLGNGKFRQN